MAKQKNKLENSLKKGIATHQVNQTHSDNVICLFVAIFAYYIGTQNNWFWLIFASKVYFGILLLGIIIFLFGIIFGKNKRFNALEEANKINKKIK